MNVFVSETIKGALAIVSTIAVLTCFCFVFCEFFVYYYLL